MKNYKDFEKVYIGSSDIASLTLRCCYDDVSVLKFGKDGSYSAYECFGDVEIGSHYEPVFEGETWLKIYDDTGISYERTRYGTNGFKKVTVYRAGEMGCIIHWHD